MQERNREAAGLILAARNPHLTPDGIDALLAVAPPAERQQRAAVSGGIGATALDLHGLHLCEARVVFANAIALARQGGRASLTVVTGVGRHSGTSGPVLLPMVKTALTHKRQAGEIRGFEHRDGRFVVQF